METAENKRECDLLTEQSTGLTRALLGSLDEITSACILVNDNAEVRFCNVTAEQLVMDNADLYGQDNRLRFSDNLAHIKLLSVLGKYGQAIQQGEKPESQHLFATRQSSAIPYYILIIPLSMHSVQLDGNAIEEPVIMVLIHDPDIQPSIPPSQYAEQYSLTEAELEVTQMITGGLTPIQITDSLSVSINTTRTHIRSIYKKTGVNTQIELVLKLANVPNWFVNSLN